MSGWQNCSNECLMRPYAPCPHADGDRPCEPLTPTPTDQTKAGEPS